MDSSPKADRTAVERAKYKLHQAEIALAYLRQVPQEIAADLRKGRSLSDPDPRLDTFFFSCLGLAQSAFYIMQSDQGGRYKNAIRRWKTEVLDERKRTQFNRMMALRDNDVHHGLSDGKALATLIPIERGNSDYAWMYQPRPNFAVFGVSRPVTEHINPDGRIVSSYEGLQGSRSLFVEVAGEVCEGSIACERFMAQLKQMIDFAKDATVSAVPGITSSSAIPG